MAGGFSGASRGDAGIDFVAASGLPPLFATKPRGKSQIVHSYFVTSVHFYFSNIVHIYIVISILHAMSQL